MDGSAVLPEHLQPSLKVGACLIEIWLQPKTRTEKTVSDLGHEPFLGIAFVAPEFAARVAIEAPRVTSPMANLVVER